jgi:hypothetical protein
MLLSDYRRTVAVDDSLFQNFLVRCLISLREISAENIEVCQQGKYPDKQWK